MQAITVLLMVTLCGGNAERFIEYTFDNDNAHLFYYLNGMRNEFFVDIGAYDPTVGSKTLPLLDWHGIHV